MGIITRIDDNDNQFCAQLLKRKASPLITVNSFITDIPGDGTTACSRKKPKRAGTDSQ